MGASPQSSPATARGLPDVRPRGLCPQVRPMAQEYGLITIGKP